MRKTTKLFLGFTAGLLLLCGCSAAEEKLGYENAHADGRSPCIGFVRPHAL